MVAGHGLLDPDGSPSHMRETRRYILDLNAIVTTTSTALGPGCLNEMIAGLASEPHKSRFAPGDRKGAKIEIVCPPGSSVGVPGAPIHKPPLTHEEAR